jgi:stearoyl-CoA desaturase (delta-9 desaturase)
MFRGEDRANPRRYAKDLLTDPDLRVISGAFPLVGAGRAGAPVWSWGRTNRLAARRADGPAVGGAVRIFLLRHATFSINSLCHFFGRRPDGLNAAYVNGRSRDLDGHRPLA